MNQSNKKKLEYIKDIGVNYFLQDSPRNWFEKTYQKNNSASNEKLIEIQKIIEAINKHQTPLKNGK